MSIDLLDPELQASGALFPAFEELRRQGPVVRGPGRRGPGYWSVLGYAEISEAARNPAVFSSWWGTRPEAIRPRDAERPLHNLDPPEHGVLREIARSLLTPDRILPFQEIVRGVVRDRVTAFVSRGGGDVVRDIAEPVASKLFAAWMGLGVGAAAELLARVTRVHEAGALLLDTLRSDPTHAEHARAAHAATTTLTELLRDPSAPPGTVLGLLGASVRTGVLEQGAATNLAALLVEAGMPTLIDAIGFGIIELAGRPPPTDMNAAVAELLRLGSPILQFARRARTSTTLGGQRIEAGEQIVLWFAAANRDPAVFADPARFDPDRRPNPHLAFGTGPHRCLGGAVASEVLHEVFTTWCRAAGHVTLASTPTPRASSYLRGFSVAHVNVCRR